MAAGLYVIPAGADAWASYIDQAMTALNEGWVLDQAGTDATGAFTTRATFATSTTFTLAGDQTATYVEGRRLRIVHAGGTTYCQVMSSVFGATTTVTIGGVTSGPTTMTTPITSVAYGVDLPSITTGNYIAGMPWQVLERKTTTVVASTAAVGAETTLFTYTVPAALLGSSGILRLSCFGDLLNNSGGPVAFQIKIKFGATTVLANTTAAIVAADADRRYWKSQVVMQNVASASVQRMFAEEYISDAPTAAFQLSSITPYTAYGYATAAEASTGALVFAQTVTLGSTATTVDFQLRHTLLEYAL